jgi:hypothetical protein
MVDFGTAALQQAQALVQPGTYVVSSRNYPRTGYVRVTGSPGYECDQWGECEYVLQNAYAQLLGENGAPISTAAELNQVDEATFIASRAEKIPPLPINPTYAGSFINSDDAFVSPAIGQALLVAGINQGYLPIGTVVIVVFQDGTSAQYRKVCQCTEMWIWNGKAWNAQGKRITRNGTLVSNPNTTGQGTGASDAAFISPGGSDIRFDLGGEAKCSTTTQIRIDGTLVSSVAIIIPC